MNFEELKTLILEASVESIAECYSIPKNFPDFDVVQDNSSYDEGNEGLEKILYFPASDVYVKLTGYHESYSGTFWNPRVEQVFPEQKTITVYLTKK